MGETVSSNILTYLPEVLRNNPNIAALFGGINPATGLPATYTDSSGATQTAGIGGFLNQLSAAVNAFKYYNDFSNIPISQVNNFVSQFGVVFPPAMSEASRRKLARDIIAFNRANGSIRCLAYIFSIIGLQVEVQHAWMLDSTLRAAEFQTGNFDFIFSNPVVNGKSYIDQIIITNGGSGYTGTPTITFVGGGGTGAAATAVVVGNVVTGAVITNYGYGYTSAPSITFAGGSGTGAAANTTITLPQHSDGSVSFHDGMYMFGTSNLTKVYYQRVPIRNEAYVSGAYVDPSGRIAVKLPYLFLNITNKNYNSLTATYTDPVTGVITPFSATDKFMLIEQITNYFTKVVRPTNVVFLSVATAFELVDTITSTVLDESVKLAVDNAGVMYDGTIGYGVELDRYVFGQVYGGFQYGNNNMTFDKPISVNPSITYTNSTGKTYFDINGVLQTAAPNVWPDEYDPVTHAYLGKSIWQSSTNNTLYSQDTTQSAWGFSGTGATRSAAVGIAPDGTNTACSLTAGSTQTSVNQGLTLSTSSPATMSLWVKGSSTSTSASFGLYDNTANTWVPGVYTVLYGVGSVTGSNGYGLVTSLSTTSWTKVSFTSSGNIAHASTTEYVYPGNAAATSGTIYTWGIQEEATSFPTPYIPTTSAAVARAIDQATFSSSLINLTQGSFVAAGMVPSFNYPAAAYPAILQTNINQPPLYFNGGLGVTSSKLNAWNGTVTTYTTANVVNAGAIFNAAMSYSPSGTSGCLNAGVVAATSNVQFPTIPSTFYVGGSTGYMLNGWISNLAYYPYAMTAAQLQAATTPGASPGLLSEGVSLISGGPPVEVITNTYNATVAGLQEYVCCRCNTNVLVQAPAGCVVQLLGTDLARADTTNAQIVYQANKTISNFNAFKYNILTTLQGTDMRYNGNGQIGQNLGGSFLNGWISELAYYPYAMTEAQLQATTGTGTFPTGGTLILGKGYDNPNITYTNSTGKTYFDINGVLQTAAPNVWPDEYDPNTRAYLGKSVWQSSTNYLLNSGAPATQTTGSLAAGSYILWSIGTGTATLSAGTGVANAYGSSSGSTLPNGAPFLFTVTTAGTFTVTVAGSLTRFQLENSSFPTTYIPTTSAAVTRSADIAQLTNPVSIINSAQGTFVATAEYTNGSSNGVIYYDGYANDYLQNAPQSVVCTLGGHSIYSSPNTVLAGQSFTAATQYSSAGAGISMNGDYTFSSTVVPVTSGGTQLTYTPTTITRSTGSWVQDNFMVGEQILIENSSITANNGLVVTLVSVTSTELTVSGPTLVAGTSSTDTVTTVFSQNIHYNFSIALNILTPVASGSVTMTTTLN